MYCKNCGKEINSGDAFCGSCGQPVQSTENVIVNAQEIKQENVTTKAPKTISIKKDTIKKWGPVVGAVAVALIIVIAIIVNLTTKVSLEDYVAEEISFGGINGYGYVDTSDVIDYSRLQDELIGEFKGTESMYNEDYWEYSFATVNDYIEYTWDALNGSLSNGDIIVLTVSIDKTGMKENKFFQKKISGKETQFFYFEVQGLEEGVAIDVFDAVEEVVFDTTKTNYKLNFYLKDNYEKSYDNNITVKVEYGSVVVYGDDFRSFSVDLNTVTDNINEKTKSTKLEIDCDPTDYVEYGLVISPSEKEFDLSILSYVEDGKLQKNDVLELKTSADELASELFDITKFKFDNVCYYECDGYNFKNALVFYYTDGQKFYPLRFEEVKVNQKGEITSHSECTYSTSWLYNSIFAFNNINECETNISATNKYPITID